MSSDPFDKVTSIGEKRKLSPRAERIRDGLKHSSHIQAVLDLPYLVKGWLDRGATSLVYGPSNVGKTFFALDIADHISKGRTWGGARVRQSRVLYIGIEGGAGLNNRIAALDDPDLWTLSEAVVFSGGRHDAGPLCDALERVEGLKDGLGLIIIDTLARSMGAADENASKDMAEFLQAIDLIRKRTDAHIMIIHHCGKDGSRGARGHSSLRAAVDTEIELTREGGQETIEATTTKQRDMPTGKVFAYRLKEVTLGADPDGDPVNTCVVEPCEPAKKKPTLGPVQRRILDSLREYVTNHGQPNPGGTGWPEAGAVSVVNAEGFLAFVSDQMTNDNPKDRRKTAKRALDGLVDKSLAAINRGKIWLV